MHGENNEKEVDRGWQPMHGEKMIRDQRAKAAVTWAVQGVGALKSGCIDL